MQEFYLIGAVLVTIVSAARITRLCVYDDFPPIAWVRARYKVRTEGTGWDLLAECGFCFAFWVTVPLLVWGILVDIYTDPVPHGDPSQFVWWVFNGIFCLSYLAAMTIARDGDK